MNSEHPQAKFMQTAIDMAQQSYGGLDYGIGAVVVKDDEVISMATNITRSTNDPTQHAEVVAISRAARKLGSRHLQGCVLYTTHEPCAMCTSAAVWGKLDGIVFGAPMEDMIEHGKREENKNYNWRIINFKAEEIIAKSPNQPWLIGGFMREECNKLFCKEVIGIK